MYKNNNKYGQTTLSKFDIIGSYFVNLFYNEFYTKAITLKANGTYNSITEAYNNILISYLDYIKKEEFFKQIIKGIHIYCISTTKHTTMTHKECIEFMVHEFIPEKLWSSLREKQKSKLFHEVMGTCITTFIENIIKEKIYIIIDNHKESENVIILQDMFLNIILLEKDKIYSKFLNPNNTNTISIDVFKNKITEILKQKKELLDEKNILLKSLNSLKLHNEKNVEIITTLQEQNKKQQLEIKSLKDVANINKKLTEEIKSLKIVHLKSPPPLDVILNKNKKNKVDIKKKNEEDLLSIDIKNKSDHNSDIESEDEVLFEDNYE